MPYVVMTRDFSEVKKPISGIGLTKRQLLFFSLALLAGIPTYLFLNKYVGVDVTGACFGLAMAAMPFVFIGLYKKDGMYIEKHLKYAYETRFVRNTERPYVTRNLYEMMEREKRYYQEVEKILGEENQKGKFRIPLVGTVDRKTKKELEKAVKKAKMTGKIPESAQDTIPYRIPYEDGIFESAKGYYTKTIAFEDVTYQLLDEEPKNDIFERWCNFINYFDPDVHFQLNYANMEINKEEYSKDFIIPLQEDGYNIVRGEYSKMLVNQFQKGTNNLRKERYLTYGVEAVDYKAAKLRLGKITKQIEINMKRFNGKTRVLNGYERLELLFRIFHPATKEKLIWNFDLPIKTGLSSKDFIAPDSFSFKHGPDLNATKYFRVGDRIGAVSYIKVYAEDMEDRIIADILNLNSNVWISIHADTAPRDKALQIAKDNLNNIQQMIIRTQKDAVKSGYDMEILPPELEIYKDAGEKLYRGLQRKNERLFISTITVVQTAGTRKELEENIFELNGIITTYQCALTRLDNRQEQGYMSSLPLGNNNIEVKRSFTTTDMAIFIPFTTEELYAKDGQYYGMNSLSNNVILANRKMLVNPNGLVFGQPGFGKSFFIKREILDVFLKTKDDRIIIDPEGEYIWLVKLLGGQVINVSLNAKNPTYINPLEINLNAQNEEDKDFDPISAKCNFVTSFCELILGNNFNLDKNEISVIDRACKNVYFRYAKNPVPEKMPILEDLYNELRSMPGEMKAIGLNLSIALDRYVHGTLSYFNHRSNVKMEKRLVCFNLKKMDNNQRDLTMLIIQDHIWDRVAVNRELDKYTWVDIDEFHLLLRNPRTAAYCVEIWKRFRKWKGIPTGITQNIKDLFRSPEIQNILDTTNFISILNQAGDDARLLAEHLELSDEEVAFIKSGEPGKGLLCVGQSKLPFEDEYPVNTISYKVMTTRPGEAITETDRKNAIKKKKQEDIA